MRTAANTNEAGTLTSGADSREFGSSRDTRRKSPGTTMPFTANTRSPVIRSALSCSWTARMIATAARAIPCRLSMATIERTWRRHRS